MALRWPPSENTNKLPITTGQGSVGQTHNVGSMVGIASSLAIPCSKDCQEGESALDSGVAHAKVLDGWVERQSSGFKPAVGVSCRSITWWVVDLILSIVFFMPAAKIADRPSPVTIFPLASVVAKPRLLPIITA